MLDILDKMLPQRFWAWTFCGLVTLVSLALLGHSELWGWPALAFGGLTLVGAWDYLQARQSVRRNYPVLAHFRFFFEFIRPEIRQYFIESDTEELPYSRAQRSIIYQRAKGESDKRPFGTQLNVYEPQYEWINHSLMPATIASQDFACRSGGLRAPARIRPA